jgi:hypothetical protein
MSQSVLVEIEMPTELAQFRLPAGVNQRLEMLLDRQDQCYALTASERAEAEGLVNLADLSHCCAYGPSALLAKNSQPNELYS